MYQLGIDIRSPRTLAYYETALAKANKEVDDLD